MLNIRVESLSGHWALPVAPATMSTRSSYPVPPPSTIRGFLESLCGWGRGEWEKTGAEFAYGLLKPCVGAGFPLVLQQTYASAQEVSRPIYQQTYYGVHLQVSVRGSIAEKTIRDALAGKIDRFGILSLGASDDMVSGLYETAVETATWVVPGKMVSLPIYSAVGIHKSSETQYAKFDLVPFDVTPDVAWLK